jgi:biotin transport system substrate-specific component
MQGDTEMNVKRLIRISMLTSILSILSIITIPVGPVPVTLQTFGVLLCGYILGPIDGALSVIIYILIGIVGVPVFSGGKSGFEVVLGPTGGYLISFIISAAISGYASKKSSELLPLMLSGLLCMASMYVIGVPYLSLITGMSLRKAVMAGAYPFILPDMIKMVLAVLLSMKIKNRLIKENIL